MSGEINRQRIFRDLLEQSRKEGINTKEEFSSFVDEKVDDLLEWGELDDDADTEGLRAELLGRWEDIEKGL